MIPTHEKRLASARYSRMGHQECDRIHMPARWKSWNAPAWMSTMRKPGRFWWPVAHRPTASASASPNTW
jgi:hypothetical protein